MRITVEISLYPLNEKYAGPIKDFINRLKNYAEIEIVTNATSTIIAGEHAYVFDLLKKETEQTFAAGKSVFVMKILGFDRDIERKRE